MGERHLLLPVAGLVLLLAGCGSDEKASRGLELMPDMFVTPAFKSQTSQERAVVAKDGTVTVHQDPMLLQPMPGTVPRSGPSYALAANDWEGARKLQNPVIASREVLWAGQQGFNSTCATCHGRDGDATHGNMAKYFSGVPSINTTGVASMPDGEVYHIISMGRNRMPHFRAQLPPEQRWAVVLYTKALARATVASAEAAEVAAYAAGAAQADPADAAAHEAAVKAKALVAQRAADLQAIQALSQDHAAVEAMAPLVDPGDAPKAVLWPSQQSKADQPHAGGHP